MSEPAVTRITTKLSFEKVQALLKSSCREPFTILLAAPEEQGTDDGLILNLMFADEADLARFQIALGEPQAFSGQKSLS